MKTLRFAVFILCFQLEVRVKAEIVTQPEICIKSQDCLVSAFERQSVYTINGQEFILEADSAILVNNNGISLLNGRLIGRRIQYQSFVFEYGRVDCQICDIAIERGRDRVEVEVLSGQAQVEPRKSDLGQKINLSSGQKMWLGKIRDSVTQVGFPKPSSKSSSRSIASLAREYGALAESMQSKRDAELHRKKVRQDLERRESEKVRKLFRKKHLEVPDLEN